MSGDLHLHIDFDDNGLQRAFELAPAEMGKAIADAVEESAAALQRDWRSNARKTARRHGKHYPRSITTDLSTSEGAITADVGPDRGLPQGSMGPGFEYGSVNQPPHMDGAAALAENVRPFEQRVSEAIGAAMRGLE